MTTLREALQKAGVAELFEVIDFAENDCFKLGLLRFRKVPNIAYLIFTTEEMPCGVGPGNRLCFDWTEEEREKDGIHYSQFRTCYSSHIFELLAVPTEVFNEWRNLLSCNHERNWRYREDYLRFLELCAQVGSGAVALKEQLKQLCRSHGINNLLVKSPGFWEKDFEISGIKVEEWRGLGSVIAMKGESDTNLSETLSKRRMVIS